MKKTPTEIACKGCGYHICSCPEDLDIRQAWAAAKAGKLVARVDVSDSGFYYLNGNYHGMDVTGNINTWSEALFEELTKHSVRRFQIVAVKV